MYLKKNRAIVIAFLLMGLFIIGSLLNGCSKEEPLPDNPYDQIDYGNGGGQGDTLSPTSIVGLHRNVFAARCATPGCHDGNFEPDFRSVQSTYSTLVYHPIKKNNANNDFTFRVVPYDTALSVLYERITNCCFVNTNDRMPQDNIGVPLEQQHIDNIAAWIMDGARDMFGQVPKYPNTEPTVLFYVALDDKIPPTVLYSDNRVDSVFYNSFLVPNNVNMVMAVFVSDDSTTIQDLQVNKLKMSLKQDDFSSAWEYPAQYVNDPINGNEFWLATVNTGTFPTDTTIFMRYYVNDGDHANDTEFPENNTIYEYKTYWSFKVEP